MFTAEGQRNIIIVLMVIVIGVLLFPERIRKAILEVEGSNGTDKGREHDGNQNRAPSPQNIRTLDTASASA